MDFRFDDALPVLRGTPAVVRGLLHDLPVSWTAHDRRSADTWSPFDIVGHLIHADRTDWMPRVEHLLTHGPAAPFPPFDREAMFAASQGLTLDDLLDAFDQVRRDSLARLAALKLTDADLAREGRHPEFGVVTLSQHLAERVAHDLSISVQIVRVMAHQYSDTVGPWRAYLSILAAKR